MMGLNKVNSEFLFDELSQYFDSKEQLQQLCDIRYNLFQTYCNIAEKRTLGNVLVFYQSLKKFVEYIKESEGDQPQTISKKYLNLVGVSLKIMEQLLFTPLGEGVEVRVANIGEKALALKMLPFSDHKLFWWLSLGKIRQQEFLFRHKFLL